MQQCSTFSLSAHTKQIKRQSLVVYSTCNKLSVKGLKCFLLIIAPKCYTHHIHMVSGYNAFPSSSPVCLQTILTADILTCHGRKRTDEFTTLLTAAGHLAELVLGLWYWTHKCFSCFDKSKHCVNGLLVIVHSVFQQLPLFRVTENWRLSKWCERRRKALDGSPGYMKNGTQPAPLFKDHYRERLAMHLASPCEVTFFHHHNSFSSIQSTLSLINRSFTEETCILILHADALALTLQPHCSIMLLIHILLS